jgi:hypothetical protein
VKRALALLAAMAMAGLSQAGWGQPADDAIAQMRACLQSDGAARLECVDRIWRELTDESTRAPVPLGGAGNWVISETTSPVDYSAQITAAKLSHSNVADAPSAFSIRCRGQRIELSVGTVGSWRASSTDEFRVVYRVNEQPAVEERWAASAGGRAAVFRGDAIQFLRSLPDGGRITVSVFDWQGPAHEATFDLGGLDGVRQRIGAACKQVRATDQPPPRRR